MLKRTCTTEKQHKAGTSLVVQGSQFQTSNAGGMGSIPGQETKGLKKKTIFLLQNSQKIKVRKQI